MPLVRALLVILAASLAALAATVLIRSHPEGGREAELRLGFNELRWSIDWQTGSDEPLLAAVNVAALAGADTSRIVVPWSDVVDPSGGWDESAWSRYRDAYRAMIARGMKPVIALVGAPRGAADPQSGPDWAQSGCTGGLASPPATTYDSSWQELVVRAVNEFDDALGIQVWNEPNSTDYWGGCAPDPGRYLELVELATQAVAGSEHPDRAVISAGLNASAGSSVVSWDIYLGELLAGGLLRDAQVVGLHPYPSPIDCVRPEPTLVERLAAAIGEQVDRAIDLVPAGTPIWVTEFGASSAAGLTGDCRALTEQQQGEALTAMYAELQARARVQVAIVHQLVDDRDSSEELQNHFGVTREVPFLEPKPAFSCLAGLRDDPAASCAP